MRNKNSNKEAEVKANKYTIPQPKSWSYEVGWGFYKAFADTLNKKTNELDPAVLNSLKNDLIALNYKAWQREMESRNIQRQSTQYNIRMKE